MRSEACPCFPRVFYKESVYFVTVVPYDTSVCGFLVPVRKYLGIFLAVLYSISLFPFYVCPIYLKMVTSFMRINRHVRG